jgi:hypothetical protein
MLTVQDSVPFWDCSEFAAAAIWQQVPHPPGAPLFLIVGKVFDILIPFGDPGWKMNMVSVLSSAVTIWLLYHIGSMVINNMVGKRPTNTGGVLAVCGSALVGALAFTFTDTFWFNAVESEVYAMSTLFVAIVVYLLMLWNERADEPGHEKYLLLIMYVIGLAIGVHLLAVLAIFTIGLVVYFRKYTSGDSIKINGKFIIAGSIILVFFALVYKLIVMSLPAMMAGNFPIKNLAQDYVIADSGFVQFLLIAILAGLIFLLYRTYNSRKSSIALLSMGFLFVLMGYTTYTHILIRSNANPPMNENEPKDFTELARYIGREQYGNDASWPRRVKSSYEGRHFVQNYIARDSENEYVYGEWFEPEYEYATNRKGVDVPYKEWPKINSGGELAYLWKFQMYHMYFRYLLWNYAGKVSDEQDASAAAFPFLQNVKDEAAARNWDSGYKDLYPISYFALPLLLGLFGLVFHFYRDPKMAFSFLVMFLLMGVLMAVAQQQQDPQPRERDYFYTGSFMVFAMWIGLGVYGLIDMLSKNGRVSTGIAGGITALGLLIAPLNLAIGNWETHDRTGNYIPFDYSYNILQSLDEDAIVFTYGDNDTFPLWYLQDVMGVRRDVRIVNLSLANTIWYVDQLKNREPWGTEKIPIEIPDEKLKLRDELDPEAPGRGYYPMLTIDMKDIPAETMRRHDPEWVGSTGSFNVTIQPRGQGQRGYNYQLQDIVLHDIVKNTRFERPVFFSTTVPTENYRGLQPYLRAEGMALRICPIKVENSSLGNVDMAIMEQCLMNVDNTENFATEQQYGFKLRSLNDPTTYFDPVHRRLTDTYRSLYLSFAEELYDRSNDLGKALKVLDSMEEYISETQFPPHLKLLYQRALLLRDMDAGEELNEAAEKTIEHLNKVINNPSYSPGELSVEISGQAWGPYRMKSSMQELQGDYEGAIATLKELDQKVEARRAQLFGRGYNQQSKEVEDTYRATFSILVAIEGIQFDRVYKTEGYEAAKEYAEGRITELSANPDPMFQQAGIELGRKLSQATAEQDNVRVDPERAIM